MKLVAWLGCWGLSLGDVLVWPSTESALPVLRMCTMEMGPSRPSTATPMFSTSHCTATTMATSSQAAGRLTRYSGPPVGVQDFGRRSRQGYPGDRVDMCTAEARATHSWKPQKVT